MDSNDTRRRTTTNTEDPVRSTAYARLLKRMQGPADYWDRPTGDWGPRPARTRGITASTARADANSAYRLATRALRRGELNAARAAFTLALTEQHPGAAFRIVLTEPQRLMVFIPTGSGKTESSLWVVRHLMEAARWGHADAQQLLDGIQTRPLHPLEQVLADAQHAAAEGLWSGLTFTCPPLAYEAQDDEFYPAVRDLLTQLLKAPAAALEAGPSSRARALPASPQQAALPASRPLIALPPTSSGISQEPLDTLNGSRIEAEDPAATPSTVREALELAGNGEPACLTPFNNRSFWGKAAPVKMLCLGGWGWDGLGALRGGVCRGTFPAERRSGSAGEWVPGGGRRNVRCPRRRLLRGPRGGLLGERHKACSDPRERKHRDSGHAQGLARRDMRAAGRCGRHTSFVRQVHTRAVGSPPRVPPNPAGHRMDGGCHPGGQRAGMGSRERACDRQPDVGRADTARACAAVGHRPGRVHAQAECRRCSPGMHRRGSG